MNFRGILPPTIFLLAVTLFSFTLFHPTKIHSVAAHLVISEIQVGGVGAGHTHDEFVELYNPTESTISLSNLQLKRKSQTGSTVETLVASLSGSVDPHKFFLIANADYTTIPVAADVTYASSAGTIADNSTILLYASDHTTVIDKVGMGLATDVEASAAANPAAGKSIERKALPTSTVESMTSGDDLLLGNGEDSDNNSSDFILRDNPFPQNSASPAELVTPTATPTPTITITPTATPTATPTPTDTPTSTPTPTATPTPTMTPSPTPTSTPTPIVTITPTPTATPSVTPTLTPLPNPATDVFGYFAAIRKIMQNTFKFYFPFLQF